MDAINACSFQEHEAGIDSMRDPNGIQVVAQLVVRSLPEQLVRALKHRAAKRNRSAEQEHREILTAALRGTQRKPLAEVLASMPNVGKDSDFARDNPFT
jgi:plasmid stability protein